MSEQQEALTGILNYQQMADDIGTSGQPKVEQFGAIADAGFRTVINLAMPDSDHAIADEGNIVTSLGMRYIHMPVVFENPTIEDLRSFFALMRAVEGEKIWVHCAVNARVSAFIYHYLRYQRGASEEQATSRLLSRWLPQMDDAWRRFLSIRQDQI